MLITSILMMTIGSVAGAFDVPSMPTDARVESQSCEDVSDEQRHDQDGNEIGRGGERVTSYAGTRHTWYIGDVEFVKTESTRAGLNGSAVKVKSLLRRTTRELDGRRFVNAVWSTVLDTAGQTSKPLVTREDSEYVREGDRLKLVRRVLNGNPVDVKEYLTERSSTGRREVSIETEGPYVLRTSTNGGFTVVESSKLTCVYDVPTS